MLILRCYIHMVLVLIYDYCFQSFDNHNHSRRPLVGFSREIFSNLGHFERCYSRSCGHCSCLHSQSDEVESMLNYSLIDSTNSTFHFSSLLHNTWLIRNFSRRIWWQISLRLDKSLDFNSIHNYRVHIDSNDSCWDKDILQEWIILNFS